jgi:hypothetical protein
MQEVGKFCDVFFLYYVKDLNRKIINTTSTFYGVLQIFLCCFMRLPIGIEELEELLNRMEKF